MSSGVHQGTVGSEGGWGGRVGAVGCYGQQDLFSITGAPALPRRREEGGEEECGWGLLGLLQTLPAPCLALALCTRCFQGRGCRIQCKRQRHDLHVKLNSPQCQLSPEASWKRSRGLNPLQLIQAVPCSLPRALGSATVPQSRTGSLGWGSPWGGFTGCEKEKLQIHIVPPRAQPLLPPWLHQPPKRGFPSTGHLPEVVQPQFPSWGVERKLILCISPFSLGFGAQRWEPLPCWVRRHCRGCARPRGNLAVRGGRSRSRGGAESSRSRGRTPAHK